MRPITPSLLRAHLECEHRVPMDRDGDPSRRRPESDFQRMLREEGLLHERSFLAGLEFVDLSALAGDEKEGATRAAIAFRAPLIYQGRLSAPGLVGEPDLLRREDDGYVPIEIKSGAALAADGGPKLDYGVQVALYVDLLERNGVSTGPWGYVWDRERAEVRYRIDEPITEDPEVTLRAKYLALRSDLEHVLRGAVVTEPAAASVCKSCPWQDACFETLRARDDLTLLADLGRAARDALRPVFPTVAALADGDVEPYVRRNGTAFRRIGAGTLRTLQRRARLARTPGGAPYLPEPIELPSAPVELHVDIEDDPPRGLCYLHGFWIRDGGEERYLPVYADGATADAERRAYADALAVFRRWPQALVVHYGHHEKTYYRRLQRRYPELATAAEIESLYAKPRAIDLYALARRAIWPAADHSVKSLAQCLGFRWRDANPSGAASVEWYHRWVQTGDAATRQRILDYNEDDCRAMPVVLDALRAMNARAAERGDASTAA